MKLAYFAHDLADAAVHRRVRMLARSFDIAVLGFRRSAEPIPSVAGCPAVDLGRTFNAQLAKRAGSVLRAALTVPFWRKHVVGADIIMARQLEMLTLAALARRLAAPRAMLVYECLDIHRMMIGHGTAHAALRALERRLLRGSDLLAVSSPAFLSEYFANPAWSSDQSWCPPHVLLENKVLASELPDSQSDCGIAPAAGPPWRIGWFGVIRCRRSLLLLSALCRALPGMVEVTIRGRVSDDVIPDFDQIVAATPGIEFLGRYDRHTDLPNIYGAVHFNWVMDFFESPGNSEWLLPNRLYEGSLYGAVPLGLASVETGRWLQRHGCGILLDEPLEDTLVALFKGIDQATYVDARGAVARLRREDLVEDDTNADDGLAALLSRGKIGPGAAADGGGQTGAPGSVARGIGSRA
jgi:succinoglycan biosynthesis protein ExoL